MTDTADAATIPGALTAFDIEILTALHTAKADIDIGAFTSEARLRIRELSDAGFVEEGVGGGCVISTKGRDLLSDQERGREHNG